MNKIFHY